MIPGGFMPPVGDGWTVDITPIGFWDIFRVFLARIGIARGWITRGLLRRVARHVCANGFPGKPVYVRVAGLPPVRLISADGEYEDLG